MSPKGVEMMEKMIDRAHGKATQKSDIDIHLKKDTDIPNIAWIQSEKNDKPQ